MHDSMAYPGETALDLPTWKTALSTVCAVLLALIFAAAGVWKITDPIGASARLAQAQVPGMLSLPAAVGFGIAETLAAVLLIVPRFRRWGAWLTGLMLVAFMAWVGFYYDVLRGAECSCFPLIQRAVGPGFFIGDGLMLAGAVVAGAWARRPSNLRVPLLILGAISVFAAASLGIQLTRQQGTRAPETITVDGKPFSLHEGRVVLYFFDPECMHCFEAAKTMGGHRWQSVKIISIPTRVERFAQGFLDDTKLNSAISNDLELLKKTFPFGDPPFGVALEGGYQKAAFVIFDANEPAGTLRKLGFIE